MKSDGGRRAHSPVQRELAEAVGLLEQGAFADAIPRLVRLLSQRPQLAEAHYQLGRAQRGVGQTAAARDSFLLAVRYRPDFAHAWYRLGNDSAAQGDFQDALANYDRALASAPELAVVHFNRGVALRKLGRMDGALDSYARAIELDPTHVDAYCNRGNLLVKLRRHEEALAHFQTALQLNPQADGARLGLAGAQENQHQYEAALSTIAPLLARLPEHADALCVRGSALLGIGRPALAMVDLQKALALGCEVTELPARIGLALTEAGQFDAADEHYAALVASADERTRPVVEVFLGLLRMTRGDFKRGWPLYESRRRYPKEIERMRSRGLGEAGMWCGESSLAGRTLLVLDEQGYGDSLQFWRLLPLLTAAGARVLVETKPGLQPLFAPAPPGIELISEGGPYPPFDCWCPLLSLPLALGLSVETIPAQVPYVQVPAARQQPMQALLGPRTGRPRVGLAWSGNPAHDLDHRRSLPLAALAPLLRLDCEFHIVQKDLQARDLPTLAAFPGLRQHGDALGDFADTAALLESLDLTISVDTSLAHLAGALGRPVWVLVTATPDFRWLLGRDDSPWYPSARIFRQPAPRDWASVVTEVCRALEDWRLSHRLA